ncbi:MAG: MATE family efflux transporter, partial [Rhodospirillaceae bacterium]|nr:MATE family efflux transporter [Rhodospirillaceae bacterium]
MSFGAFGRFSYPRRRWLTEAKVIFSLAWPIILGNLTHMAIFATDTAFIGHYAPEALASAALAGNMFHMIMAVGFGLSMVSAPMMANALGFGLHAVRDVRRTVRQTIWVCWVYSGLGMAVLWNGEGVLLLLGQEPTLSATAGAYLRILQWMMFPLLGFWVLRFFVLTLNRTRVTLAVTAMGIVVNALGNYTLVFGHFGAPELGLRGSGIASVIASTTMFVVLAVFCMADRRLRRFAVLGRFWRPDWPRFFELWRLGLPIGITSAMEGLLFCGSVFIVGQFGADSLAAHAIVMQLCGFAYMIPLGLSEAATIRVGLWAGRRDPVGVTVAGDAALILAVCLALVLASVMVLFPRWMIAPFLDVDAVETAA